MKNSGIIVFAVLVLGFGITLVVLSWNDGKENANGKGSDAKGDEQKLAQSGSKTSSKDSSPSPRVFPRGKTMMFWWDKMPEKVTQVAFETGPESNIHPADYAGAESCKKCHEQNYSDWHQHPHAWMNAKAEKETVKGDFSGKAILEYLGGKATFDEAGDKYRMSLERDGVKLVYEIDQTLGSRFFQYYIGKLTEGPFVDGHPYRTTRHVLPFGYWLSRKQWVPVVHVGPELPDGQRTDPFAMPQKPEEGKSFLPYAKYCNMCHSTFALGDNLFRKPFTLEKHFPGKMHIDMAGYVKNVHSELWPDSMTRENATQEQIFKIPSQMTKYDAEDHGVSFGISCEACHYGCKDHVEDPKKLPSFVPRSEYLRLQTEANELKTGRTHENLNWSCAKCHTGGRPMYAAGIATWNSTEYTDAMKGSCYSQLNCVQCHQPHEATGQKWKPTPAQDDANCIHCHQQYKSEQAIADHTHHPIGSKGSRCMNCHMPKLNEGLQEVVRTHTIFSPTNKEMLESNHPNACNMCHTDKTIDWTVEYLGKWYNASFDKNKIQKNYKPGEKVGMGWLKSENEAVRLIGIDSMGRNKDRWAGEDLVESLDDPYLINRQFAMDVIEKVFDVKLDDFGYRFYMTPEERESPLKKLKESIKNSSSDNSSGK